MPENPIFTVLILNEIAEKSEVENSKSKIF